MNTSKEEKRRSPVNMLPFVCFDLFLLGLDYPHPPVGFLSIHFGLDYLFHNFHRQRWLHVELLLESNVCTNSNKNNNDNDDDKVASSLSLSQLTPTPTLLVLEI
ncbi:hypothetical protein VTN00DRAFT_6256 [Thermoascus crustaceus]|uniref:uncharacterized protein n=1 Tax=Thermoascus crustaceus TaxID=5088 RepID=UPI003742B3ED